jgi:hypothetical protein
MVHLHHFTMIILLLEVIYVMEFTGLEQTVVLNNHVLHRNNQLLTNRELQLQLRPQPSLSFR